MDSDSAGVYFVSREIFEARSPPRGTSAAKHDVRSRTRYVDAVSSRSQFFRASVGAVLCGRDGRVLAFERADHPGAWQLPQGGLEAGEEPAEAVFREVHEETGIDPGRLELLWEHPAPLVYELPAEARSEKTGRGQVQYWFYFACAGEPALPKGGEFRAWRWMDLGALAGCVIEFRRGVYEALAAYFDRVVTARKLL